LTRSNKLTVDDNAASAANGSDDEPESEGSPWEENGSDSKATNALNGDVSGLTTPHLTSAHLPDSHGSNLLGTTLQEAADELTHEPDEEKAEIDMELEAAGDGDVDRDQAAEDAIAEAEAEGEEEVEPGAEDEAEADVDAEVDAEAENENEPEVAELDPSDEHDLNSALRVEALDALSAIEIKFALLRERVYVDKMTALLREEELVDDAIHPELGYLQRELEKRRERRCTLALRKRKRDEEANISRKKTSELSIEKWYTVSRSTPSFPWQCD
jgi:hypothetical protein